MSTDDDVDWTWCALAQDCVDVIQCHAVNHSIVDLHDLIPTPKGTEGEFRKRCWRERKKITERNSYFLCMLIVLNPLWNSLTLYKRFKYTLIDEEKGCPLIN